MKHSLYLHASPFKNANHCEPTTQKETTMIPAENTKALVEYIEGWKQGDGQRIHAIIDDGYFLTTGLPGVEPVPKAAFVQFLSGFRETIAQQGGPAVDDAHFMDVYGINRRQIGDKTVESALFVVPGFASGTYLIAAQNGKVLFEDASILPVTVTAPE